MICPVCHEVMIWQNDYDDFDGETTHETYTDYLCMCGTSVTVPWSALTDEGDTI